MQLTLLNYDGPSKDKRQEQFDCLEGIKPLIIDNMHELIWGGDMNLCIDPMLDKYGGKTEQTSDFAKHVISLLEENNLIDIWRITNPDKRRYTWRQNTSKGIIQSRLDYWFIAANIIYDLKTCDILNSIYSDHNPISLELFQTHKTKPGRGFWKLNVSLLKEKKYVDMVNQKLDECINRYSKVSDKGLLWDATKAEIRGITISYATHKAKSKKEMITNINNSLQDLEIELANDANDNTLLQINRLKKELELHNNEITQGAIIRAKCKHLSEFEKSTKFFLNLEKANAKTKAITCLHNDNGEEIHNTKDILEMEEKYYSKLYTEQKNFNSNVIT
jgi:hypothetical protein